MPRSRNILGAAAAVTLAAGLALVPSAGADATSARSLLGLDVKHTLNALPGLSLATDHGAVADTTRVPLVITLAQPRQSAVDDYAEAVGDRSSPDYRHFLTPAQFAERFGVPQAETQAVRDYLTGKGLAVDKASAAGDVLSVHGSASAVDAAFHTTLKRYTYKGLDFMANTVAPTFPKDLTITNVAGLDTLTRFATPKRPALTDDQQRQQDTCLADLLGGVPGLPSECLGVTTPDDLKKVYERPDSLSGKDQGLAVLGAGESDSVVKDLRQFETEQGLPQVPVTVKHPEGDTDFSDTSGGVEWDMDTQASSAMAPDASGLTMYFGSDLSDQDVIKVFSQFTDDTDGPKQASASYGECEQIPYVSSALSQIPVLGSLPYGIGLGNNLDPTLSRITEQAAVEGKTVFVSTGDTGSSCPAVVLPIIGAGNGLVNQGLPVTNSPASLPYVTAVGGTVLYTDGSGNRAHEYGWTFSGGGSTLFTPAPEYQQGVAGNALPCVTDPTTTCRGISDVAAQSGDALTNGFDIVSAGQDTLGGGTSLSAPLMQGLWASVQSSAPSTDGYGFANYGLYAAGKNAAATSYFDVSSFDPQHSLPATNGLYPTLPGWDYPTGWGTPKVAGLACYLNPNTCS